MQSHNGISLNYNYNYTSSALQSHAAYAALAAMHQPHVT